MSSRYRSWAVIDVENWSSRPAVNAARIQQALRKIEATALRRLGLEPAEVPRQPTGDGAILALPGDIAKELITTEFVDGLREATREHNGPGRDPQEVIRLRLSLHAGEALDGDGEYAGQPVIIACRLVDSPVIRRVLAASVGYPLALIISASWYDAVIREGYAPGDGYQEVWVTAKTYSSTAWVNVPGRRQPLGLLPEDDPGPHRDQEGGSGAGSAAAAGPRPAQGLAPGGVSFSGDNKGQVFYGSQIEHLEIGNVYHGGASPRAGQ